MGGAYETRICPVIEADQRTTSPMCRSHPIAAHSIRDSGRLWGMDEATFLARYPRVWHLAHGDAWPGLRRHGLLSAQRLVELFERGDDADPLLGQRRPDPVVLEHPVHGSAILRDQHPLNAAKLQRALQDGMEVEEWLRLLNRLVFFFPSRQALDVLASAYADQPQLVLTLNTRSLVAEYGVWVKLASINTGSVLYNPAKRGRDTFLSIARHDPKRPVKEIAVHDGVPDLVRHLITVERRLPDGTTETIPV
jgi:hypothetical protein